MDGRFLFYFDITSKQAVSALYDEKKMEIEDLRLIFSGFVKAMEDAAEYLMITVFFRHPDSFSASPSLINPFSGSFFSGKISAAQNRDS